MYENMYINTYTHAHRYLLIYMCTEKDLLVRRYSKDFFYKD